MPEADILERPVFFKSNLILIKKAGSWWLYLPKDVRYIMRKYGLDPYISDLEVWITHIKAEPEKITMTFEIMRR